MNESFLERAKENLDAAQILFERERFNASANRAYYAAFHAALAALFGHGFTPNTDHKVVQAMFSGELINRRKLVHSRFKGYLQELQDIRNDADYKNGVSKSLARTQLKKSTEFVHYLVQEILP